MSLPRVFFDANGRMTLHGYWLGFDASRRDLAALGDDLRDGCRVIICDPGEFEMEATLRFDPDLSAWLADPVEGTLRYLDGSEP